MSVGTFLAISIGCVALLLFARTGAKGVSSPFLHSLLRRLLDTAATATLFSFVLWSATALLRWHYDGAFSTERLVTLAGYQNVLNSYLEKLPPPWLLAVIALALVVWTSSSPNENGVSKGSKIATGFFLRAQPWLNRAAILATILSAFTFLNSDGKGVRLWLDLQMTEVKTGAETLDQAIEEFAATASANELYNQIVDSLPQENWGVVAAAANRLSTLEFLIDTRRVNAGGSTVGEARALTARELRPHVGSKTHEAKPFSASDETYSKLSAKTLSEFTNPMSQARSGLPQSVRAGELRQEIRAAFLELAGNAAISKTTPLLTSTGNAFLDLLADAVTETAIERMRERIEQFSSEIRSAIRGNNGSLSDFKKKLSTIVEAVVKDEFVVKSPGEDKFRHLREVQDEALQLDIALKAEDRGICPQGEVSLRCPRNGISFCGPRSMVGTPC